MDASAPELEQVFLNLLLNALDVMPEGGILAVTADPGGGWLADGTPAVQIVVADTGPGIPEEAREHVFDPFWSTKATGTGVGLAICQSIVMAHSGTLTAANNPDEGAVFCMRLPVPTEVQPKG